MTIISSLSNSLETHNFRLECRHEVCQESHLAVVSRLQRVIPNVQSRSHSGVAEVCVIVSEVIWLVRVHVIVVVVEPRYVVKPALRICLALNDSNSQL